MRPKFKPGDLLHEPRSPFEAERTPFLILEFQEFPMNGMPRMPIYVILEGEKIGRYDADYVDRRCEKAE